MARLNKIQIYAIRWLNSQGKDNNQIADELNLTETQIKNTIEKYSNTKTKEDTIKTKTAPASRSHNLMIRETAGKKTKNVAIMTQEASQLNDELQHKTNGHPLTEKSIYRPRSQ